jgi:hypothetical protein
MVLTLQPVERIPTFLDDVPPTLTLQHFAFCTARGTVIVKALRYKPEGRGFEIR